MARERPGDPCHKRAVLARLVSLIALLWLVGVCPTARAEPVPGDPTAYDLRIGLFPVAFQAGVSQSWLGSAARVEYGVLRNLDIGASAKVGWANVIGEKSQHSYSFGGTLVLHVQQSIDEQKLAGTVYPTDVPAVSGNGTVGADHELDVPVSQRIGGPRMGTDQDNDTAAMMRSVYSLRLGFSYQRAVESSQTDPNLQVVNTLPMLHAGYGWGTHWNLAPRVTGRTEVGFRRFYVDLLATMPSLTTYRVLHAVTDQPPSMFPLGLRIGMEGSIDAFWHSARGVGFAYTLELGALPGRAGLEGYLLVGLGLALDAATR